MAIVRVSTIIHVPINRVWGNVRDFATHVEWIHGARVISMEGGTGTTVGVVRTLDVQGMIVVERLTALDDDAHSMSYTIVGDLPLPMYDIHGSIAMVSDTSADSTLVERILRYDTPLPRGEADAFRKTRVDILAASLEELARYCLGR
jgi:Polyketide cyclase / dehydrase and lipid transport